MQLQIGKGCARGRELGERTINIRVGVHEERVGGNQLRQVCVGVILAKD